MKKTWLQPENDTLYLLRTFLILVCILIGMSLFFKSVFILKHSRYGSDHSFIVGVSCRDFLKIFHFAPDKNTLSVLTVTADKFHNKDINTRNVRRLLAIPIDETIEIKDNLSLCTVKDEKRFLFESMLRYNKIDTQLTFFDLARLMLFTNSLSNNNIKMKEIVFPWQKENIDKLLVSFFSDTAIVEENISIEIDNGTDVSGLGNRLARLITNMGGNVITVSTSDIILRTSEISYSKDYMYTVERLTKILRLPAIKVKKQGVSDIIIKIGKDLSNTTSF